jgi:IBR domain, a half RING-finger domain
MFRSIGLLSSFFTREPDFAEPVKSEIKNLTAQTVLLIPATANEDLSMCILQKFNFSGDQIAKNVANLHEIKCSKKLLTTQSECIVCYDTKKSSFLNCEHGHSTCLACLKQHFLSKFSDSPQILSVTCPGIDSSNTPCQCFVGYSIAKTLLTSKQLERGIKFIEKSFLENSDTLWYCNTPSCTGIVNSNIESLSCSICKSDHCPLCHKLSHPLVSCDEAKTWTSKACLDPSLLDLEVFCCPGCGSATQKDEGCDHMTCRKCRHEYCYICLKPYTRASHHCERSLRRHIRATSPEEKIFSLFEEQEQIVGAKLKKGKKPSLKTSEIHILRVLQKICHQLKWYSVKISKLPKPNFFLEFFEPKIPVMLECIANELSYLLHGSESDENLNRFDDNIVKYASIVELLTGDKQKDQTLLMDLVKQIVERRSLEAIYFQESGERVTERSSSSSITDP